MEFHEVVRRRAMVRSFATDPVDPAVVDTIVRAALRAPSAGNTRGTEWVVLAGEPETTGYWEATTDRAWREASPRWEGLRRAPVILLSYASAEAYVSRYAEADKVGPAPDLGTDATRWPVPYWIGDAAFGVMTVLLAAVDAGLGACVLGNFRGEAELARALAVPVAWRLFCAVLLGHPDANDHPSRSLDRAEPQARDRIHHRSW
ncbi:MAG: nitroreductase family protein [Acidimicrobiales bacterium]|jgi:nitroreductase